MKRKMRRELSGRAKEFFLPAPQKRNAEEMEAAAARYRDELPQVAEGLRECGSKVVFDAHVHEMKSLVRKTWLMKVKSDPPRSTAVWSATADSVEKQRSIMARKHRALTVQR